MVLTITIANDTDGTRLINDICAATNYDAGSGKTKAQWVKEQLVAQIRRVAKQGELRTDSATISAAIDAIAIT